MGIKRVLSIVVMMVLVLVAAMAVMPQPAVAHHEGPPEKARGPSEKVGVFVGHFLAVPFVLLVGGIEYLAGGNGKVTEDFGDEVVNAVSWLVAIPEHSLLAVVDTVGKIARGEGCDSCPLPRDADRAPPSL